MEFAKDLVKDGGEQRVGGFSINTGKYIRNEVIKNLLKAQERIADTGNAKDNVRIAKFLLKTSQKFNNDVQQICSEENKEARS